MPGLGMLAALWGAIRASAPVRWALVALGIVGALLGWRALERRDAARDRERELRRKSAEAALRRERKRQDAEDDAAGGSAAQRLRDEWSRPD